MINIGQAWPGKNDMKAYGNPMKFVTLLAENEAAYMGLGTYPRRRRLFC